MSKELLILESPLSGKYYATRAYKIHKERNFVEVTGKKEDVTKQIQRVIDKAIAVYKLQNLNKVKP